VLIVERVVVMVKEGVVWVCPSLLDHVQENALDASTSSTQKMVQTYAE